MPESFCDRAAAEHYSVPCTWTDGTRRVVGAPTPVSECPAGMFAGTPLCGPPCIDRCPLYNAMFAVPDRHAQANVGACIGRSDTRQFGICAPDQECLRGRRDGVDACADPESPIGITQVYPEFAGTTCVCIVFRGAATADGLSDYGFVSTPEGCRGYRALYPDDVECVIDRDWHTLP